VGPTRLGVDGLGAGMTRLALIAAVARNDVIGHEGGLVWRENADQRWFRQQTTGCPVIMGRKTWDSLPARFRPLPNRINIVVTRQPNWQAEGATVAHSLAEALAAGQAAADRSTSANAGAAGGPIAAAQLDSASRIFVIGGAQLYAEALPLADELVLTEIDADLVGDTRFPGWNRAAFTETGREPHTSAGPLACGFAFVTYQRRR